MKVRALLICTAVLVFLTLSASSFASLTQEERLADFNELTSTFERNYGPLQWKAQSIGLDWYQNKALFRSRVAAAADDAEFYRVLAQYLASFQDGHVSSEIPSSYVARLGFLCDYIEGKVVIEDINTLRLPEDLFPFKKGDQVLAMDGVPVEDLLAVLMKTENTGSSLLGSKRLAALRLSSRPEAAGFEVPTGVSTISVLPKGAADPVTVTVTWYVSGTPALEQDNLGRLLNAAPVVNYIPSANNSESVREKLKSLPMFNAGMPEGRMKSWIEAGLRDIGNKTSMFTLPAGAQVVDGVSVTSAVYEAGGKKIGILRMPSYEDEDVVKKDIATAIETLEANTDVLVLDQTNNPGGRVDLASAFVSFFANKSFKDMNFALRPSMEFYESFRQINGEIADKLKQDPSDPDSNALQARFAYLEQLVRDGIVQQQFLTKPVSLNFETGFGMIQPNRALTYTKPILMLINELDFSGADAVPAILKDNGRVTLFGEAASGAGGNVAQYGPLTNSYFKFSLTQSLMVRPNGDYVENKGVTPDIHYSITEDDFENGYRDYTLAFTQAALYLVGVDVSLDQLKAEQAAKAEAGSSK